jgi:hypothetical protein
LLLNFAWRVPSADAYRLDPGTAGSFRQTLSADFPPSASEIEPAKPLDHDGCESEALAESQSLDASGADFGFDDRAKGPAAQINRPRV